MNENKLKVTFECDICCKTIVKNKIKRSDNLNNNIRLLHSCSRNCTRLRKMIGKYKVSQYVYDKYNVFDPTYWLQYFNRDPYKTVSHINKLNMITKYFKPNNGVFLEDIFKRCNIPNNELLNFVDRIKNNEINFEKLKNFGVPNSINRWLTLGFSDDASEKISNFFRTNEESFILRGETRKDYEKWKEKFIKNKPPINKSKSPFFKEYWKNKGYNEEESKQILSERNRRDLDFFINKYGVNIGTKKYFEMCQKRKYSNTLEGYIDKYGEEDGREKYEKVKNSKVVSLEKQIERYGLYEGIRRHNHRINKMVKTISNSFLNNKSKTADLFFDSLEPVIGVNIRREEVVGNYICDGFLNDKHLIIEFFGDWWHKNPLIYNMNENMDVISNDRRKIEFYKSCYNVIIVWESCMKKLNETLSIVGNYILLEEFNFEINLNGDEFLIDSI